MSSLYTPVFDASIQGACGGGAGGGTGAGGACTTGCVVGSVGAVSAGLVGFRMTPRQPTTATQITMRLIKRFTGNLLRVVEIRRPCDCPRRRAAGQENSLPLVA